MSTRKPVAPPSAPGGSSSSLTRRLFLLLVASLEAQVLASTATLRAHPGGSHGHAGASGRPAAGGKDHGGGTSRTAAPAPELPDLGPDHAWKPAEENIDPQGWTHTQWQGWFKGLQLEGSIMITHHRGTHRQAPTPSPGLAMGSGDVPKLPPVHGSLEPGLDLGAVEQILGRRLGAEARPPAIAASELILFPVLEPLIMTPPGKDAPMNAAEFPVHVVGYVLAYRIRTQEEPGREAWQFVVDAHAGRVLRALPVAEGLGPPAKGKGRTLYSGDAELDVTKLDDGKGYALVDQTRGQGGNRVEDQGWFYRPESGLGMWEAPPPGWVDPIRLEDHLRQPELVTSPDDVFGDSQLETLHTERGSRTARTAAADAAYGLQVAWDFYDQVLKRNGCDGKGSAVRIVVHAFNVNDANEYKGNGIIEVGPANVNWPNVKVATIVHEFTHGVIETTSKWVNDGEMGGLNEGTCDFFGQMADTWKAFGGGNSKSGLAVDRIGDKGTAWEMRDHLRDGTTKVLRSLAQPALTEYNFDAMWKGSPYINAGPLCRALYLLSTGASNRQGRRWRFFEQFAPPLDPVTGLPRMDMVGGMSGLIDFTVRELPAPAKVEGKESN